MPTYSSKDDVKSGVPLGGIGAGTLQVFPDGTRGVFTGANNWESPLGQLHWFRYGDASDYRVSNPFAIYVEMDGKKAVKFLQTASLDNCPTIQKIEYKGEFPVVYMEFKDDEIPVNTRLVAFSPFIGKNSKDSGIPGAIYRFEVNNPNDHAATVSVMASAVNVNGSWNVGRLNEVVKENGLIGINFKKNRPHPRDERAGIISLAVEANDSYATYMGEWPYVRTPFKGGVEDRRFDAWKYFSKDGTLPNTDPEREAMGEMDEWMAALAVKFELGPHQTKEVNFYYTWFMPNHYLGHAYENWFNSSWDVVEYLSEAKDALWDETQKWQKLIKDAPMPAWLKDALINSLSVITAASWWTKDGSFAMYENPVKWPLMDSLDVRYYGTVPLALFFPDLEKKTMELFAKYQRPDGRIPHDLGRSQIDCPSDGTTAGIPWKDLSTKFALMAYRDYLWTGDKRFLKMIYPKVKRAMEWEFGTDKNGDFLPDNEGKDSTYDLWDFHGTGSYVSSIFLAALLASERLADLIGDKKFAQICREWFEKGKASFEKKLWNGSYYICYSENGKSCDASCAGQLNGQWYAHLLGLGYLLPEEHVRAAVKSMMNLNAKASKFGAVNSVYMDGRRDTSSYHAENIWAGESYALAALAIYEGLKEEGLELAERVWKTFAEHNLNPWYQTDVIFAEDGKLGDGELYVRNLAVWTIPFALARFDEDIKKFLIALEPSLTFKT